jgi:hypothetical protein
VTTYLLYANLKEIVQQNGYGYATRRTNNPVTSADNAE